MIYWDHNATTPLNAQVAELLQRRMDAAQVGNASSVHQAGRQVRHRMEGARERVAAILGCERKEIVFTASGTDGNALCVKGAWFGRRERARSRIVTSAIEHPAVMAACEQLERHGAVVTRVKPDSRCVVDAASALGDDVALCSVMWVNNETGVVQPVRELAAECRRRGIVFHTDAVQAAGKLAVNTREVDADLITIAAHKFGGPAGVGACVVRNGVPLEALAPGHQENGRRGGTQNVPYIEALALALEVAAGGVDAYREKVGALRDEFERRVLARVSAARVNGAGAPRVANTSSVTFEGADGEAILISLDLAGVCVSTGAACASGSLTPSHVLLAMGLSSAQLHGTLRFSLGSETTVDDVERVVSLLERSVPDARRS